MRNILIIGTGRSGMGAAKLAAHKGLHALVSNHTTIPETEKKQLEAWGISYEESHQMDAWINFDFAVKSPGVPEKAAPIAWLRKHDIPVISEIEFAAQHTNAKLIAITGSNGKTTTTSLTYHILKNAGFNVGLAGNIGNSFAASVAEDSFEYYVLEISSFQLDDIVEFKPFISMILNITPDHLDRYNYDLKQYAEAKFKITQNQDANDFFIYNFEDKILQNLITEKGVQAQKIPFSLEKRTAEGAFLENEKIIIQNLQIFNMTIAELSLQGKHNVANSMAAALAANLVNIRKENIRKSLENFAAVEHRLEPVISIRGVHFINDSKATNVNATYYALESMEQPIIWIVGGEDKGNDYHELLPLVRRKVKGIVCLGADNHKLMNFFGKEVEYILETKTMTEAVQSAFMMAKKGDAVLLSPACASFDLFDNFEARGRLFKEAVKKL